MRWITAVEALRILLVRMLSRARNEPAALANAVALADSITSDEWFTSVRWQANVPAPAEARLAAERARQILCGFVNEGAIALRGELHSRVPPIDINETECVYGVLDVFGATLTVHSRVYRHILLNVDNFLSCLDNFEKRIGLAPEAPLQETSVSSGTEALPQDETPATAPSASTESEKSATAPHALRRASHETYAGHQLTTRANSGSWATRKQDENWAKANNYVVDHVRGELRRRFREALSEDERIKFGKRGRRQIGE